MDLVDDKGKQVSNGSISKGNHVSTFAVAVNYNAQKREAGVRTLTMAPRPEKILHSNNII